MKRDTVQMIATGAGTVVALVGGKLFPAASDIIWGTFLSLIFTLLVVELRKPVNYHSLLFFGDRFEFSRFQGMLEVARWDEIVDVHFFRYFDPFTNDMETEWLIKLSDGRKIDVLVEFMHRRQFAKEIAQHLTSFNSSVAHIALGCRAEGRWHCFTPAQNTFQPTPLEP